MKELPYIDDGRTALSAGGIVPLDQTLAGDGGAGPAGRYLPGDIIDGAYQLLGEIGRGGMGVVFACRHTVLDALCAIKLLDGDELTGERWQAFKGEAKALARLKHAGIVTIYNMGVADGQCPYFVMDLLSGESLDTVLRQQGRLPVSLVLDLFIGVADALYSAHGRDVIHRDIKPSNLMLVRDGTGHISSIKIVDFGIARVINGGPRFNQYETAAGQICGTPLYMSPEQSQGQTADARSDIYSLGCTLFEALTGSPPFRGNNCFHTFMMHQNMAPPSLVSITSDQDYPAGLEQALKKMLSKEAALRYQSMAQVKQDLERIKEGKPIVAEGTWDRIGVVSAGTAGEGRSGKNEKIAMLFALACILMLGFFLALHFARPAAAPLAVMAPPPSAVAQAPSLGQTYPDELGVTVDEVDSLLDNCPNTAREERRYRQLAAPYMRDSHWLAAKFKCQQPTPAFIFPRDLYIGAIKIGDEPPSVARGIRLAPPGQPVTLYLPREVSDCPQLMDKFGPDDIESLAGVFTSPREIIKRVAGWHHLRGLSFFNPLVKALPNCQQWEESRLSASDLDAVDKLSNLRSLGLCGPEVTGTAVSRLVLLNRLEILQLKRISDLSSLLEVLPHFDNISELWLVEQNLHDEQLAPLTRMKGLKILRIRRSQLTPASLAYFKKMPGLTELWLDRNTWSEADRNLFMKEIPGCQFEKVVDYSFWRMAVR